MQNNDNAELMRAIFDRLALGDGSLFAAHLADDVVMRVTGQYSWSRTFRGKQALLRNLYGYLNTITSTPRKTFATLIVANDEHVIVEAKGMMKHANGTPYENEYCLVFRLRDGKIIEMREYLDSILCERVLGPFPSSESNE